MLAVGSASGEKQMCDRAESVEKPWQPQALWRRLQSQTSHGLATGALKPIDTHFEILQDGGIDFIVRVLANLNRKDQARKVQARKKTNPFLPYDPDLYVTDISDTHLCLLNKFNVVDHHFLIVTRQFESQDSWLTLADFDALHRCLQETAGLFFFNGGTQAGASQPHKHLQVVPQQSMAVPMEIAVHAALFSEELGTSPLLPYAHRIAKLSLTMTAADWLGRYRQALLSLGIGDQTSQWQGKPPVPYNLLGTRDWMMVIPRSQDDYLGISVNSLGFAGSLLVRNFQQLDQLQQLGPMQLLQLVAM